MGGNRRGGRRASPLDRLLASLGRIEAGSGGVALSVAADRLGGTARAVGKARRAPLPVPPGSVEEPGPRIPSARHRTLPTAPGLGATPIAFDGDGPRSDWRVRLARTREASGADTVFGTPVHFVDGTGP